MRTLVYPGKRSCLNNLGMIRRLLQTPVLREDESVLCLTRQESECVGVTLCCEVNCRRSSSHRKVTEFDAHAMFFSSV